MKKEMLSTESWIGLILILLTLMNYFVPADKVKQWLWATPKQTTDTDTDTGTDTGADADAPKQSSPPPVLNPISKRFSVYQIGQWIKLAQAVTDVTSLYNLLHSLKRSRATWHYRFTDIMRENWPQSKWDRIVQKSIIKAQSVTTVTGLHGLLQSMQTTGMLCKFIRSTTYRGHAFAYKKKITNEQSGDSTQTSEVSEVAEVTEVTEEGEQSPEETQTPQPFNAESNAPKPSWRNRQSKWKSSPALLAS